MKNMTFLMSFALILLLVDPQETHFIKSGVFRKDNPDLLHKKELNLPGVFRPLTDATFTSGTLNYAIPDENVNGVNHTLTASGIPGGATIDSVIVTFSITHVWLEDVVVNLEAPNGQIVNLVATRGGSSSDGYLNTRATSNTSIAPFPPGFYSDTLRGTYRADVASQATIDASGTINPISPAITTSVFSNLFTIKNGSWKIHVYDISNGDIGDLVNWSIKISYTSALPVSLLNFSGNREGSKNMLKWTTVSEQNNRGFEVERSKDGLNYSSIGFVNTLAIAGNSNSLLNYTFTDNNPMDQKQYYRLRQVDFDGREKLSRIVLIKGTLPSVLTITGLFPNPANDELNLIINTPHHDILILKVLDINGRLIKQMNAVAETGSSTIPIDISGLKSGSYLLKIETKSDGQPVISKFTKQ